MAAKKKINAASLSLFSLSQLCMPVVVVTRCHEQDDNDGATKTPSTQHSSENDLIHQHVDMAQHQQQHQQQSAEERLVAHQLHQQHQQRNDQQQQKSCPTCLWTGVATCAGLSLYFGHIASEEWAKHNLLAANSALFPKRPPLPPLNVVVFGTISVGWVALGICRYQMG